MKGRRRQAVRVLLFATGSLWIVFGAGCTAERRYRVLIFFFEGVPDPNASPEAVAKRSVSMHRLQNPRSFHTAFREDRCADCHVGERPPLNEPVPDLCWRCHVQPPDSEPWNHAPAHAGRCLACHVGHESSNADLLTSSGKSLCYSCHRDTYIEGLVEHRDVDLDKCEECHPPHTGGTRTIQAGKNEVAHSARPAAYLRPREQAVSSAAFQR